jgi:serine/threonine-protein kinase
VSDDKRTRIGTGPVRPPTGVASAVAATPTPAPASTPPASTPPSTSYLPEAAQPDPLLGQVMAGRYLIQKKLGEGGMGAVYLATHNLLDKQVALKVLHGELGRKPDLVERFMQEARAASRIGHQNVIDISDFGSTPEGLVFFAMELLKGHDLHEEIARARLAGQLLPWERSKKIFLQICAALTAAHNKGIVHRDLKPENVYLIEFLGEPDFVKLLDFGIAKLTESAENDRKLTKTGMLFGTPEYMSPEQARGEPRVDHRVDVYAMGCILFQLVTGRVPFEAENFMGVLSLHLTEPPPQIPAEVFDIIGAPRALAGVIDRALIKDRDQRIQTIEELARAVRQVSGDKITAPVTTQANVVAPSQTANRVKTQWTGNLSVPELDAGAPPKKSKLPMILGAVILVGGAAAAAGFLASRGKEAPAPPPVVATGSGSQAVAPPPLPPPVKPAEPPPLAFEWSTIKIESVPSHADVTDLASGKVLGKTPFTARIKPSRTARQFELRAKGYMATVVELVPDREKVDHKETLEKGAGTKVVPAKVPDGKPPELKPGVPETKPDVKVPDTKPETRPEVPETKPDVKVPEVKPPEVKPPAKPDDDCGDPPCLKADPSRPNGSAAP